MGAHEIMVAARKAVHSHMHRPALYLAVGQDPLACLVRVHTEFKALGDIRGTSFGYGEREEAIPRIIFDAAELPTIPARGAIVSLAAGEAYSLDATEPADKGFWKSRCVRLPVADTVDLPIPQPV